MDSVIYWDASAVISCLFSDTNSEDALNKANSPGLHLISTLTYGEVCAVIARVQRGRYIEDDFAVAVYEAFASGPWRNLTAQPDIPLMKQLAVKWPLRGAELWHLACALTLRKELPELILLTYDNRLKAAAEGEGLSVISL